jgi:hypothetical protein
MEKKGLALILDELYLLLHRYLVGAKKCGRLTILNLRCFFFFLFFVVVVVVVVVDLRGELVASCQAVICSEILTLVTY